MKFFGFALVACCAVIPFTVSGVGDGTGPATPEPPRAPVEPSVAELVAQMGHDSYALREAASKKLWQLGAEAREVLRVAASGDDPEIALRSRKLLSKIDLDITPDTNPEVVAIIERYQSTPKSERPGLLDELRQKRAYRQLLRLYATETDEEIRKELKDDMGRMAVSVARERIVAKDLAGARDVLDLAPADAAGLAAWAAFHRANGTLDEELKRLGEGNANQAAARRLALLRAAGRFEEARTAAIVAGDTWTAALMAVMMGDPLPWLKQQRGEDEGSAADNYSPLAVKRLENGRLTREELAPVLKLLNTRNTAVRANALNTLYLLGEVKLADEALVKLSNFGAFVQFDSLERLPDALTALGLDPQHPDFTAWVGKRFEQYADASEDERELEELVYMAAFLESRGLAKEQAEAYDKPLRDLAEKDSDEFLTLLGHFTDGKTSRVAATGPVLRVGTVWAGDDDDRWDDLVKAASGDEEGSLAAWKWLAKVRPEATRKQRLEAVFLLAASMPDPARLREQWLKAAWAEIDRADPDDRPTLLKHLGTLLGPMGDLENQLKIGALTQPDELEDATEGMRIIHLSGAGRWEDAAKAILGLLDRKPGDQGESPRADLHAYAASSLRRAGDAEAAAKHDALVDLLALGETMDYVRISLGYAYGEDFERSFVWLGRAVAETSSESGVLAYALAHYYQELLRRQVWPEAASVGEVLTQLQCGFRGTGDFVSNPPVALLRLRVKADMARGLAMLGQDRARGVEMLERCHAMAPCDGSLSDDFFPALRKAGLLKEHDAWFEQTWSHLQDVIKRYPDCHNVRNSAAWLAARSMRRLDEAEAHLKQALANFPYQAAYLDTMAELQFARGNRKLALKWSDMSLNSMPADDDIRRQHLRFAKDPLPK